MSAIAIAISIASYNVAKRQSDAETNPHFYLKPNFLKNPNTGKFDTEQLQIYNDGASFDNLHIDEETFVDVKNRSDKSSGLILPLYGYYFERLDTNDKKGLIALLTYDSNLKKYTAAYFDFLHSKSTQLEIEPEPIVVVNIYYSVAGASGEQHFLNGLQVDARKLEIYKDVMNRADSPDIDKFSVDSVAKAYNSEIHNH